MLAPKQKTKTTNHTWIVTSEGTCILEEFDRMRVGCKPLTWSCSLNRGV